MKQIFESLKKLFPGKESVIQGYEKLSIEEGISKASEQLAISTRGMKETTSEFLYTAYAIDVAISKILCDCYSALKDKKTLPDLVIDEKLSIKEKLLMLQFWCETILKKP